MGKHASLVAEAQDRGYFYDQQAKSFTLWREYGEYASAVYIDQDGSIRWAVYGPDERFGFFSRLVQGRSSDLEAAEEAADRTANDLEGWV